MTDKKIISRCRRILERKKEQTLKSLRSKGRKFKLDPNELIELVAHTNEEVGLLKRINSAKRQGRYLRKIKAAIKRIEDGDYLYCRSCGEKICESRLVNNPTSTKCVICQEGEERRTRGLNFLGTHQYAGI